MSEQTPTLKVIPIETPVAGTVYENFDFMKECVTVHSKLNKTREIAKEKYLVNQLIYLIEEEEIKALENPANPSYQKLQATLQPIMSELHCNIFVFVGHKNQCEAYLDTNEIVPPNTLPTLILVVACFSHEVLVKMNTKQSSIDKNLFFFGFKDYMHLLHGDILACKVYHFASPYMDCRFQGAEENRAAIEANASLYSKSYAEMKDLLKCCEGRYEHFKQVFYDYLVNRECVRFPTESLLAKFRSLQNSDGTFIRDVTRNNSTGQLTMSEEQKNRYIFSRSEGVPCTAETCSTGKTKYSTYKANLANFDDRVKYGNTVAKKLFEILNDTDRYTAEEKVTKDKEMVTLIKQTDKPTIQQALIHKSNYRNEEKGYAISVPLFFFIFAENYKLATQEILLSFNLPLDILVHYNSFSLISMILDHLNRNYKKIITEAEAYRLIQAIGKKDPKAITAAVKSSLLESSYHKDYFSIFLTDKCHLPIIELLFYQFSDAIPIADTRYHYFQYFIGKLSGLVEHQKWTVAEGSKVLELFLSFGKINPPEYPAKTIPLLEIYDGLIFDSTARTVLDKVGPNKLILEFVVLFTIYGENDPRTPGFSLDGRIAYWTEEFTTAKVTYRPKIKNRILKILLAAKDFFDKGGQSTDVYKNGREEMLLLLEEDLDTMERPTRAIQNVRTFFGEVQPNITKRRDLNAKVKANALKQLAANYKNIRATNNEGQNALRRLTVMRNFYSQFLRNHPKDNKVVPSVPALQELPEVDTLWGHQYVETYLKSLKPAPKPRTARKPKMGRITNISALQTQLANIVRQLNAHNSGAKKIHGMTVKRLRRERGEIEQRLRNLTPAVEANAANNNTENENNQGGGRRRTRKLRR